MTRSAADSPSRLNDSTRADFAVSFYDADGCRVFGMRVNSVRWSMKFRSKT